MVALAQSRPRSSAKVEEAVGAPIRTFLVDDHTLFRQGLRQILELQPDFQVVGEAEDAPSALSQIAHLHPNIVIMDINLPGTDGVQATQQIANLDPQIRVVILTMYPQEDYAFQAIRAGAWGYLVKTADAQELLRSLRAVHCGEALVNPTIALRVLHDFQGRSGPRRPEMELTERERDILRLLSRGASNQEIAHQLSLSEKTVENRLTVIFQKLHLNNRVQAVLYALRQGLASLGS